VRLEASAAESGLTVGEWCREVLLKASGQPAPLATPTEETLLSELLALRTILLNLFYDVASGAQPQRPLCRRSTSTAILRGRRSTIIPAPPPPYRTYNFTYLTSSNYTSLYIRNRLTLATVGA
jgi:hypothetical protein